MQNTDIESMQREFVNAFDHQYAQWTLADLGKDPALGSIRAWLENVAVGEAEEYRKRKGDPNRRDIVAVNQRGDLIAYTAIDIMHGGRIAYLAQGFIAQEYQRRGAESHFIRSIIAQVLPRSVSLFTLLVRSPHNEMAARAHEANGFIRLTPAASEKYAILLGYPKEYYIAMAQSVHKGINPEGTLMTYMDEESLQPRTSEAADALPLRADVDELNEDS